MGVTLFSLLAKALVYDYFIFILEMSECEFMCILLILCALITIFVFLVFILPNSFLMIFSYKLFTFTKTAIED